VVGTAALLRQTDSAVRRTERQSLNQNPSDELGLTHEKIYRYRYRVHFRAIIHVLSSLKHLERHVGEVIEFYHPAPKAKLTLAEPVEQEPLDESRTPAKDVLEKCLETAADMDTVLVMTSDKNGVLGFVSNCDGLAEANLFIDLIKAQALFSRVEGPQGGGIA